MKLWVIVSIMLLISVGSATAGGGRGGAGCYHIYFPSMTTIGDGGNPVARALPIVIGRVILTSGETLENVPVRLPEVNRCDGQGVYILIGEHSPGAYPDLDGNFVMTDIPPGEYVFLVGDPTIAPPWLWLYEDGTARTFRVGYGDTLDLGVILSDYDRPQAYP